MQQQKIGPAAGAAMLGALGAAGYVALYAVDRALASLHATGPLHVAGALYAAVTLVLFIVYALVVRLASRGLLDRGRSRAVAVMLPLVVGAAFTFVRPSLSIDVLTYIAQGRQVAAGANPYAQPLRALAHTPLGDELGREGWLPVHGLSPYGPIWTDFEAAVVRSTASIRGEMLILKAASSLFALGCAWLIWLILRATSPGKEMLGVVLFLWNPAVIVEICGEGHNDAVLIFFVLLSVYLFVTRRHAWGVLAVGIGALVKIVAPMVAPLEIAYAWRTDDRRRLIGAVAAGGACALLVGAATYARFWIGAATFDGLRAHGRPSVLASTPGALIWMLGRWVPEEVSARLLAMAMAALFVGCLGIAALTIKDAKTLLRACGWTVFAYLILAPGYWPWYACLPIAVLALGPSRLTIAAIIALSLGSRLSAPIDVLRLAGLMSWPQEVLLATVIGVWLPAMTIGVTAVWLRRPSRSRGLLPYRYGSAAPSR